MSEHHGQARFDNLSELCGMDHRYQRGDRFGRLFPDLPPLFIHPDVLVALGAPGGPMDAGANPAKTMTVPVGQVFFGQFVDHDITLDLTSSIGSVNIPSAEANARTPTLDLDCVYGSGPEAQPYLYHSDGNFKGAKMLTAAGAKPATMATEYDLLRNSEGVAMIGDFRNDENRIVSQIQLGMIGVHNKFCDEIAAQHTLSGGELFEEARKQTTWHYQWVVIHDFLMAMCGESVVQRILTQGRQWFRPDVPFIPVEFSVAAYRFGHSMVPLKIVIRDGEGIQELFDGDLGSGFSAVTASHEIVDWRSVFAVNGSNVAVQMAERCDPFLSPELLDLKFLSAQPKDRSLAGRNLRRGQSFLLPSGEQVANAMGVPVGDIATVSDAASANSDELHRGATPLWFWLLTEASVLGRGGIEKGEGLGPVGATIVAEVIIGLLECDGRSWLSSNRDWAPDPDKATVGDLLEWATGDVIAAASSQTRS